MRRFLRDKDLRIMDFPDEHNTFQSLLLGTQRGTVGEMLCTEQLFDRSNLVSGDISTEDLTLSDKQSEMVVPLPPIKRIALDEDDTSELIEMHKTLHPDCEVVSAERLCGSFSRVQINGNIYRCSSNCGVSAKWLNGEHRTGRVQRFLTNDVVIKQGQGKRRKLTFVRAEVGWFMSHPEKHWYPEPLEVWCSDFSQVSFIPVQRIHSQCLTLQYKVKFRHGKEKVYVTIPLIGQFCS